MNRTGLIDDYTEMDIADKGTWAGEHRLVASAGFEASKTTR
jgi:hypothetical protein